MVREKPWHVPTAAEPSRRGALLGLFWFVAANAFLLIVNASGYLSNAAETGSLGWVFVRVALIAQISTGALLVGLILALLILLLGPYRAPNVLAPVAAFLFVALGFFILLDRKQYALFRFHLNGLAVNILATPGGWESMHIGSSDMVLVAAGVIVALVLEALAFRFLLRGYARISDEIHVARRWAMLVVPIFVLLIAEHATYAWADLRNVREVTRVARVIPLYQPLTVKRLAHRFFGIDVNREDDLAISKSGGSLLYPRVTLRFHTPERTPNIVWLTLDSWRYDALSKENTPHIYDFAARAQVFDHHLSGGNATRYGIFSLFYGIHGCYWPAVLAERRGPVLVSRLKDLGYAMKIESSTSLTWPEFRRTAFVEIPAAIDDNMPGPATKDRDRQLVEHFETFLDHNSPDKPFFAWLFFDSSHHPYDFEQSAVRFEPYDDRPGVTNLDALKSDAMARERRFNRYRNAVAYLDVLVARTIGDLEKRGLLGSTIIVITGDHGEEYFEHGYFGHNGAFTPEQIHVPFVYYDPERAPRHVARTTTHEDLVPTLLNMLGVENPSADYTLGGSLFSDALESHAVSCGWSECAIILPGRWIIFGTETYRGTGVTVLDSDYKEIADPRRELRANGAQLQQVMQEMSAFLK